MSKEEDIELIESFLKGAAGSFDRLVLKYQKMVFNLCFRIVHDYEDAEDCSQETFIKVFKTIKSFKFKSAFSTWLYRIAVNTCKNKLTSKEYKQKKKTGDLEGLRGSSSGDIYSSPDCEVERKEAGELVMMAIAALPDKHKILIVLRDIEKKSYEEIVDITGFKLGTVKSKISRARELLKAELKGVI